ncbi:MAG: hypothetical protein LBK95_19935 [Bifidobacteriaceae bacterium]|jgi:hypothetical protein|nr:hypothetical protein [Bifidobacteriaceae bacterium]
MSLETEIRYQDQDVSLVVLLKVEHAVRVIAARRGLAFEDAYDRFLASATHRALLDGDSLMWTESSEFIADEYDREISDRSA